VHDLAVLLEPSGFDGRLQFMSEGGKRVMQVEDFGALKGCPWPDLWAGVGNAHARQAIETASSAFAGGKSVRMPSGAGHDAQILATIMPAGMLFVPSIGGISHHWSENTDDADIVTGAEVFVEACRRLLAT